MSLAKRALAIDDSQYILQMVVTLLERRGLEVETARNGAEGLERATRPGRVPDLILTDVMMPAIDGWSLVRRLRARPELALVPAIFLTVLDRSEERTLGFRLGIDEHLVKPFRIDALDECVSRALEGASALRAEVASLGSSGLAFAGDLARLGPSAVLTVLAQRRATGLLALRCPLGSDVRGSVALQAAPLGSDGRGSLATTLAARLELREGRVLSVALDASPLAGRDALLELLTWRGGDFELAPQAIEAEDRLGASTAELLEAAASAVSDLLPPSRSINLTL
jgi:CheY-like chemotaxis protein